MKKVRLGKTNLLVTKTAFGALPIQRVSIDEAVKILRAAYDGGINFYDTANGYTDSEEKIGAALSGVRENIVIATKSAVTTTDNVLSNLDLSLKRMKTDYIDIFQLHNPASLPSDELMDVLQNAKKQGKIRHIGITNHRIDLAMEAVRSGVFDTMQFPFSLLSGPREIELVEECKKQDVGFIAMKAMSGGLITSSRASFGFMQDFENVVPIYGIQRMSELNEFLQLEKKPPAKDEALKQLIEESKEGLSGDFCRGCGYCLPCPQEIEIPMAARISFLIKRSPYEKFLSDEWRAKMDRIDTCIGCGACKNKCPYELDTPELLKRELVRYNELYEELK